MASGVKVDDKCKTEFNTIKMDKCYRYIIFKLDNELKNIVVEEKGPCGETYDDFVKKLVSAEKAKECRYAVLDAPYETASGPKTKLLFFHWAPDTAPVKQKMIYASSKDALQRELGDGISFIVQANDLGDLEWENIREKIAKTERI